MSESGRISRMLESMRCQQLKEVIQRQSANCCNPVIQSATIVLPESTFEQAKSDPANCPTVVYRAQVALESKRINDLVKCVLLNSVSNSDPDARFSEYRRPYIAPACPPIPEYILNGNLPKASVNGPCLIQRFEGTIIKRCQ
jgi:hypothetical protein